MSVNNQAYFSVYSRPKNTVTAFKNVFKKALMFVNILYSAKTLFTNITTGIYKWNVSAHLVSVAECSTAVQNTSSVCWTHSWRQLLVDESKTVFVRSTRRAKIERSNREYGRTMLWTHWNKLLQKECKNHKHCQLIFQDQLKWHLCFASLYIWIEAQVVWYLLLHCSESLVAYHLVFTVNCTAHPSMKK